MRPRTIGPWSLVLTAVMLVTPLASAQPGPGDVGPDEVLDHAEDVASDVVALGEEFVGVMLEQGGAVADELVRFGQEYPPFLMNQTRVIAEAVCIFMLGEDACQDTEAWTLWMVDWVDGTVASYPGEVVDGTQAYLERILDR